MLAVANIYVLDFMINICKEMGLFASDGSSRLTYNSSIDMQSSGCGYSAYSETAARGCLGYVKLTLML